MKFIETKLNGAFIIELEPLADERGFFARSWCHREAKSHGLSANWVQCNVSFNNKKGTLRGMHYQESPDEEIKLVRCTGGAIFDVIIDLQPQSSTFRQWVGIELNADNRRMLYIPKGFAHGFLTLKDCTEVYYQMSEFYLPKKARGVRWNDPAFGIDWPIAVSVISERDARYPDFIK